ncbi:MAG: pentapeptide repeat-containing protein [bacterium]|nr:pentapeptide repeat-containing protein [bacterium]
MANPKHLEILKQGVGAWNRWRAKYPTLKPDLSEASLRRQNLGTANLQNTWLSGADLYKAELGEANLEGAHLEDAVLKQASLDMARLDRAKLVEADLSMAILIRAKMRGACLNDANLADTVLQEADLTEAIAWRADFRRANLHRARLAKAQLGGCIFTEADLTFATLTHTDLCEASLLHTRLERADLTGASLAKANMVAADLSGATLTGAWVYGCSAWDVVTDDATRQDGLIIRGPQQAAITVENLEIAQFIYLLLHNEKIRHVIDTVTSKVVLILGRFTAERKAVLEALREELLRHDFAPVLFDFDKPAGKDLTGTVETLARMARFIIADLTDPRSVPHELATVVPYLRTTPVVPLKLAGSKAYALFENLLSYPWVLEPRDYEDAGALIATLPEIIASAEEKAASLRPGP